MKIVLVAFGTVLLASSALARPTRAVCVGGPRFPSYAFYSDDDANDCQRTIASQGRACQQYVRIGECDTQTNYVNQVYPENCNCNNQGQGSVGSWAN